MRDRHYGPLRALVRPYILRRLKTDRPVIADLPDKTEMRAFCRLTRKQAALYQQAVEELERPARRDRTGMERRGAILASLMRLKQICNHPVAVARRRQLRARPERQVRPAGASSARRSPSRQEKVLVFTQFREMTDPLAQHLAGSSAGPAWCCTARRR